MAAGVLNSLISAPEENTLPAPVMTTALTVASALAASTAALTALRLACDMVFIGGLFMLITATVPRTLYRLICISSCRVAAALPDYLVRTPRAGGWSVRRAPGNPKSYAQAQSQGYSDLAPSAGEATPPATPCAPPGWP